MFIYGIRSTHSIRFCCIFQRRRNGLYKLEWRRVPGIGCLQSSFRREIYAAQVLYVKKKQLQYIGFREMADLGGVDRWQTAGRPRRRAWEGQAGALDVQN